MHPLIVAALVFAILTIAVLLVWPLYRSAQIEASAWAALQDAHEAANNRARIKARTLEGLRRRQERAQRLRLVHSRR